MKKLIFFTYSLFLTNTISAFEAKLIFTANPATSKIYFNGELTGTGTATITLERATLLEVKIINEGYITFQKNYRYGKGSQFAKNEGLGGYERGKNEYTITLDADPNYVSPENRLKELNRISFLTDSINKFININTTHNSQDAWKIINQVASDYFDDIEDKGMDSGTLKTAWQSQIVDGKKIRTRIIIKTDGNSFKIKMQSEYSEDVNSSVKDDEKFKEWDRELNKYHNAVLDFINKLK